MSSSSESDDDLEDIPEFIKTTAFTSNSSKQSTYSTSMSPAQRNKLDMLLKERREEVLEEDYIRKTKMELLNEIQNGKKRDEGPETVAQSQDIPDFIEVMDTCSSTTKEKHMGLEVMTKERGRLFSQDIMPMQLGFNASGNQVDKLLASVTAETLSSILLSKSFINCIQRSPQLDTIKTWLFYIMSVHSSPTVTQFCYINLMEMAQLSKVQSMSLEGPAEPLWYPRASDLFRVLVNLGAKHEVLLSEQTYFSPVEISDHLTSLVSEETQTKLSAQLCRDNLSLVLNVLSSCLQQQPKVPTEELHLMFYMLAKTSLDTTLHNTLQREHQVCFCSILECYPNNEWPTVIPSLCKLLSGVSDHHHDMARLVELLTSGGRGEQFQISLSYFLMHQLLCPEDPPIPDKHLIQVELLDVTWLGRPMDFEHLSTLASTLSEMVSVDLYKLSSIIHLLDFSVGNEHRRTSKPKDHLEYLIEQVKYVIKGIRDSIYREEQSKIKDALSRMKVKWTLTLQTKKSVQTSIFQWTTSRKPLREQLLHDQGMSPELDDL